MVQVTTGELLKQSKHTKQFRLRRFKVKGAELIYGYKSSNKCFSYTFTDKSEALRVKNGGAIKLVVYNTTMNGKEKREVMLLKIPPQGTESAKNQLFEQWLQIFREAIEIASGNETSSKMPKAALPEKVSQTTTDKASSFPVAQALMQKWKIFSVIGAACLAVCPGRLSTVIAAVIVLTSVSEKVGQKIWKRIQAEEPKLSVAEDMSNKAFTSNEAVAPNNREDTSNEPGATPLQQAVAAEAHVGLTLLKEAEAASTSHERKGWELLEEKKGVQVFTRKYESFTSVLGRGIVAAPVHVVLQAVTAVEHKKQVDPNFKSMTEIEKMDPALMKATTTIGDAQGDHYYHSLVVTNMTTNAIFPVSARDACAAITVARDCSGKGAVLVAGRSVQHPDCPEAKTIVRATAIVSGFHLTECGPVDPATGRAQHTMVTLVSATNPKGDIPQWLLKKLIPQKAYEIDRMRKLPFVQKAVKMVEEAKFDASELAVPADLRNLFKVATMRPP